MKRLIISNSAQRDLRRIHDFIAKDNVLAADRWIDRLVESFNLVRSQPGIGRKRDRVGPGFRSIAEGDYMIFFWQPSEDIVEIIRVIHGKRQLRRALKDKDT